MFICVCVTLRWTDDLSRLGLDVWDRLQQVEGWTDTVRQTQLDRLGSFFCDVVLLSATFVYPTSSPEQHWIKNTGTTKIVAFSTFQSELSTCSWPPLVLGFCCCWALLCSSGFWLANVLWPAWVIYRLFFVCSALVPSQSAHMCDCVRTKCCQSTSWVYKEGHEGTSSSHMLPAWWRRRWWEKKNEKNQLFFNPQSLKQSLSSSPAGPRRHTRAESDVSVA